ncbi:zinc finger BED domain-containing protein RICESLEEPER 2-like [Rhododendron vialii]|uniref:zinc finger BED domain-containing protein RICESLEEPER 2-like n=1 Tax=Rhododendron vialii TaxID=182163 RepID=UPI00265F3484|nr:zinc finger BED domain-containing protein RICESLEEPER 2-like [Rhododendron vialii]
MPYLGAYIYDITRLTICKYCGAKISRETRNGTSHLKEHYIRKHQKKDNMRQQVLTNNFMNKDRHPLLTSYSFDPETARKELVSAIIMHEYPLSIVDHVGFRRYLNALQPLFKVPCRNTMKAEIFKIYEYQRGKTMSLVVSNASRSAITTNMWTLSNQKEGFMAIIVHFIDDSWTLQSRILSITVDNCSTNYAMVDLLWDKLDSTSLMLGGDLFHMRCCSHILNLIVEDGLDVIKVGIEKIQDSVAYWTASQKREDNFGETVRQLNVTSTKKLGLDCMSRWNSTFLMLQTALLYKDVFNCLSKRDAQYNSLPSECEWGFARDLIREMAKRMVEIFDKYWSMVHGVVVGILSVLDPRYKINVLEFYFKLLFPTTYKEEVEKVRAFCYKLLKEYQSPSSMMEGIGDSSSQLSSIDEESLSKYDVYMLRESKRSRTIDTPKLELDHYLSEAGLPKFIGFDVLNR